MEKRIRTLDELRKDALKLIADVKEGQLTPREAKGVRAAIEKEMALLQAKLNASKNLTARIQQLELRDNYERPPNSEGMQP